MSDFLSRLAARSLATSPAIRPRLTSLFEPVRPGTPVDFKSRQEDTALPRTEVETATLYKGVDRNSDLVSEVPGTDRRTIASATLTAQELPERQHQAGELNIAPPSGSEDEPGPASISQIKFEQPPALVSEHHNSDSAPQKPRPSQPQSSAPVPAREHQNNSTLPAKKSFLTVQSVIQGVAQEAVALNTAVTPAMPSALGTPATPSPAQDRPGLHENTAPQDQDPTLVPLPSAGNLVPARVSGLGTLFTDRSSADGVLASFTAPQIVGRRERIRSSERQPKPESESVIQVTIGRVEVRAETIAGPSRPTVPKRSPVMGLEEYLRQHARRGRE